MNLVTRIVRDVERLEDQVKSILLKADLLGLVKIGAPKDEYSGEAKEIVSCFGHRRHAVAMGKHRGKIAVYVTEHCVEDVVYAVFAGSFGRGMADKIKPAEWKKVAKAIADIGVR